MRRTVTINWGVSSYYGWGVYGLNLALAWSNDPEIAICAAQKISPQQLAVDPVRLAALHGFFSASQQVRAQIETLGQPEVQVRSPLLASLNPDFSIGRVVNEPGPSVALTGDPTIGVVFFETAQHSPEAIEQAARYPLIVTGSTWNEQVLRAHGLTNVRTVLQGVDPALFHPAAGQGPLKDRFLVFTGGKLELRKGQDIALVAFRRFAERHPDALLVAAWHSPWPQLARNVDVSGVAAPVTLNAEGKLDARAWALANGVKAENFLDAGQTPNPLMPQLYRQMDVGLFPNRCEGGTNLVAMELMACGVPAILSANTGHLDIIEKGACLPLTRQGEVAFAPKTMGHGGVAGWGESDVDEAVELLEQAYADREALRRIGARGAASMSRLSWAATAEQMKRLVFEVAP